MMLRVLTYSEIDRQEWSRLVAESETGTWFQSPEAYDFFASQPELFDVFAVALEALQGRAGVRPVLRAVCVGYVTREKSAIKQFFTRRAIIIGGPCLASDLTDEETTQLMQAVREQIGPKAIYIETRNFNDYARWKAAFLQAGFAYRPHLNFHIDTSSVEIVEANLGKSRKRDIRTTIREGVTVETVSGLVDERVEEFYRILERLYRTKVKTPLFPLEFFLALSRHRDARFLLTAYRGRIIGGTVCVAFQKSPMSNLQSTNTTPAGVVYEWFACGEDGVYPHIFPSCYATYAGIRYAAEHGCSRFDMMGAGTPDEAYGVREFKAKFGGQQVEHGRYVCVVKPLLYQLGRLGVKVLKRFT